LSLHPVVAQKNNSKKYPSLLWEISGNGLKKPSYLFGTMHVSSKMAFHLSDSFYYAIKNADAVALELNPDTWQGQMVRMDQLKLNYSNYVKPLRGDYLTEQSFRLKNYDDELKLALSTEPSVVNSLLYRSYKAREDFEEDTFLDLYIFQTGKKLGKRGTGVENYYETEKIVLQAYGDMAAEKKKKNIDTDGESMRVIVEKIQDAYKRGDLDLMDSLDNKIEQSQAFREKFLYYRNEIQANSMDSIMKKSALFVGVGAAHLPGPRGVIELLRKMGYTLRPIKMADRDAAHKDAIDKMRVPVIFSTVQSDDGFYKVEVPGPLFTVNEEYNTIHRRQYADMSNGCYYQVARVKTHASFVNHTEAVVQKKIDSLLYENIPGKILKKTLIRKNGYSGYDIVNKTRRGDMQRYNIFITPFEVLIFKMSGKDNYVDGPEAVQFFSSISLKEKDSVSLTYAPPQGGFSVQLPHQPAVYFNNNTRDGINQWEYEAVDNTTGNAYLIFKKSLYNVDFLEEDSFDLQLVEESFQSPEYFERQLARRYFSLNGYPCLEVQEKMKDSSIVTARHIVKGPHYYTLAVKSNKPAAATDFFSGFRFTPFKYGSNKLFTDSFLHYTVASPVVPQIDTGYRAALEKAAADTKKGNNYNGNHYLPADRSAVFTSDSTGESIHVEVQKFHDYFYAKDAKKFWENQLKKMQDDNTMLVHEKKYFERDGIKGYTVTLRDTGSSKTILGQLLLKNNHLFRITTIGDTLHQQSSFTGSFFNSFTPGEKLTGRDIFSSPLDSFFAHLFSNDSATQAKAEQAISYLYFGEEGVPLIMDALKKLSPGAKNYFNNKTKLIAELGYIKDTTKAVVVDHLKTIYQQTADTSLFQNEVIEALARHKTRAATASFKELVLQDPPVFDNSYAYTYLFNHFEDTLKLAANLFPEILQLTTLEDYKEPVMDLMVKLVDSGYLKGPQYESWFSKIFFDAKIALKKQRGSDEKKMEAENKRKDDEDDDDNYSNSRYNNGKNSNQLEQYAILLAPFYEKNPAVPKFFDKLLQSKEEAVKLEAAIVLLKNNRPVADSIFTTMAAKDQWRGKLFTALEKIKQADKFPAAYKTQTQLARSYLVMDKNYNKIDSIVLAGTQPAAYLNKKGTVYFFKYRVKKDDDWKMGISGLQPVNENEVSSDDKLSSMTDKKIKEDKPEKDQFQEQLKKLLFSFHPAAKNFFETGRYSTRY
jgi:uncharacterized protein YbaP (TraB family)